MKNYLKVLLVVMIAVAFTTSTGFAGYQKYNDGAWLGIYMQSVDDELAEKFELTQKYGVFVNEVIDDSPAKEAGIKDGDIIIFLNGQKITDSDELVEILEEKDVDDEVTVKVVRDGDEKDITVTLGVKPDDKYYYQKYYKSPKLQKKFIHLDVNESTSYMGVVLSDLSRQLGDYFGVKKGRGALITEVEEESPAEKAGLKAGDVIIAIDDETVKDHDDVVELVTEKEAGDQASVKIIRDKKEKVITVEIGEREGLEHLGYLKNLDKDIDIVIPHMKGHWYGDFDDIKDIDKIYKFHDLDDLKDLSESGELNKEMDQLRKELQALKKELKEIQKKLE